MMSTATRSTAVSSQSAMASVDATLNAKTTATSESTVMPSMTRAKRSPRPPGVMLTVRVRSPARKIFVTPSSLM